MPFFVSGFQTRFARHPVIRAGLLVLCLPVFITLLTAQALLPVYDAAQQGVGDIDPPGTSATPDTSSRPSGPIYAV